MTILQCEVILNGQNCNFMEKYEAALYHNITGEDIDKMYGLVILLGCRWGLNTIGVLCITYPLVSNWVKRTINIYIAVFQQQNMENLKEVVKRLHDGRMLTRQPVGYHINSVHYLKKPDYYKHSFLHE